MEIDSTHRHTLLDFHWFSMYSDDFLNLFDYQYYCTIKNHHPQFAERAYHIFRKNRLNPSIPTQYSVVFFYIQYDSTFIRQIENHFNLLNISCFNFVCLVHKSLLHTLSPATAFLLKIARQSLFSQVKKERRRKISPENTTTGLGLFSVRLQLSSQCSSTPNEKGLRLAFWQMEMHGITYLK